MSYEAYDVRLEHVEKTTSILLGPEFARGTSKKGNEVSIVGSGRTLRIGVRGIEGHVDVDLTPIVEQSVAILEEGAK